MALVRILKKMEKERMSLHEEVEAGFCVFRDDLGHIVLQIETYGTRSRKIPGKTSQCVQFDRQGLMELRRILDSIAD